MSKEQMLKDIAALTKYKLRAIAKENHIPESLIHPDPVWIKDKQYLAVTDEDDLKIHAFVTSRYKLVQHPTVFIPIIEKMDVEIEGKVKSHDGFAIMDVFPQHENYKIGEDQIGICAYNSVDKTSALNIKFVIKSENRVFVIPNKKTTFRKIHVGKISEQTKDYIEFLDKIKEQWSGIVTRLMKKTIPPEEIDAALTAMGENPQEKFWKIKKRWMSMYPDPSVWALVKEVYDKIDRTKFKSDIHKRKHLDDLANIVFTYDFVLKMDG